MKGEGRPGLPGNPRPQGATSLAAAVGTAMGMAVCTMKHLRSLSLMALFAVVLCQCGVPQPPRCRIVPAGSRVAPAELLASARSGWRILSDPASRSQWPEAQAAYNLAVAALFDQLRCGPGDWQQRAASQGTRMPGEGSDVDLAKLDAVFPAAQVKARLVQPRHTREGLGVPVVGWVETSPVGKPRERYLLPNGYPYNITATLDFSTPGGPTWRFAKRWLQEEIRVGAASHPLAADWTAPNEFFWQMCQLDDLRFMNVFLPDRFTEETGLYFVQPYDPDRIPLVLVHGLVSSPDAFKELINDLAPEPWFRENYQIWLYNYPTGNPWSFSARKFRESMNEACRYARSKGPDDKLNRMVVAAHSMGGLVTRASVTEPGQAFYDEWANTPFDELRLDAHSLELIRETMLYEPLDEPERVVFMAVPHRGSPLANFRPATWLSRLIRLPKSLTVEFEILLNTQHISLSIATVLLIMSHTSFRSFIIRIPDDNDVYISK